MFSRKKIDFFELFVYAFCAFFTFLLGFIGNNGEPFMLALLFACGNAGAPLAPCLIAIGLFCLSLENVSAVYLIISQAVFLSICIGLCKRYVAICSIMFIN